MADEWQSGVRQAIRKAISDRNFTGEGRYTPAQADVFVEMARKAPVLGDIRWTNCGHRQEARFSDLPCLRCLAKAAYAQRQRHIEEHVKSDQRESVQATMWRESQLFGLLHRIADDPGGVELIRALHAFVPAAPVQKRRVGDLPEGFSEEG